MEGVWKLQEIMQVIVSFCFNFLGASGDRLFFEPVICGQGENCCTIGTHREYVIRTGATALVTDDACMQSVLQSPGCIHPPLLRLCSYKSEHVRTLSIREQRAVQQSFKSVRRRRAIC